MLICGWDSKEWSPHVELTLEAIWPHLVSSSFKNLTSFQVQYQYFLKLNIIYLFNKKVSELFDINLKAILVKYYYLTHFRENIKSEE